MSRIVPTYTAEQVRAAERPLLEAGEPLMRRAASALAGVVREYVTPRSLSEERSDETKRPGPAGDGGHGRFVSLRSLNDRRARILVLAGSGDNGGDALYAAAELAEVADIDVLSVGSRIHDLALGAAHRAGARSVDLPTAVAEASEYLLVLDGILGIGTSPDPALRGLARDAVSQLLPAVRGGMPRPIAVDLPSGLHPDTGAADDIVLPAAITVTFGAVKVGLTTGRGPELSGDLVLVDLGLGPGLEGEEPAGEASVMRLVYQK